MGTGIHSGQLEASLEKKVSTKEKRKVFSLPLQNWVEASCAFNVQ